MTRKRPSHFAFAALLRGHLDAWGWSAANLAAKVGLRPSLVYRWTAGEVSPLDPHVAAIAKALEMDPSEVWAVVARDGVTPFGGPAAPPPNWGRLVAAAPPPPPLPPRP